MAFTYAGDPSASALAAIRFLIGDTDTNDQLLQDAEIEWVNNQITGSDSSTDSLYTTSYRCMITIASKFSRLADQSVGEMSVSMSQKAAGARAQAKELKALATREGDVPTPYAGNITISDRDIDRDNSDLIQPWIKAGQFGNTSSWGAGPQKAPSGNESGWTS